MQRKMNARYEDAVAWIAHNDESGDLNPETMSDLVSVVLIADIFQREPRAVASDVIRVRQARDAAGTA